MNIRQIREKYPQYDDMDDQKLADALHQKYYSDMPKEDFYKKIEHQAPPERSFMSKLPGNILAGLAQGGHELLNTPYKLAKTIENKVGRKGTLAAQMGIGAEDIPHQPDYNYPELLKLPKEATIADKLIRGAAQYAPAILAPEAELGAAGKAISKIPGVGKFLSRSASLGAPQAAFGATQTENPLVGAGEGAALGAAGAGIEGAINALRPSNLFRGKLSNEELQKNLEITKGTNTGLGDVIKSPFLKGQLENVLAKLPFTGASEKLQEVGKQVESKGENLLKGFLGNSSPENIPSQLSDSLTKAFQRHQGLKNKIYDSVNKLAEKDKLKLELPKFSSTAKKYMDAIENTNLLKFEPDAKQLMSKLVNYKNPVSETKNVGKIVDKEGKPLINETSMTYPSLKEANLLKGKLNHYAKSFAQSPDPAHRGMAKVFGDLAKHLKSDIQSSIEKSSNPLLKKGYEAAEENYAKNYSPFLDKKIYKFVTGQENPETLINKFIKTSPHSDIANEITKIAKLLPESQSKDKLAYGYLSRAIDNEGNLNPAKLATAINKLGKNQFKALVPDVAKRNELTNFSKLSGMNTRAQYLMHNPPTGHALLSPMVTKLLGSTLGGAIGGYEGGLPGAAIGIGSPLLALKGSRIATKTLTSEKLRTNLIKKMIEGKRKKVSRGVLGSAAGLMNTEEE